MSGSTVWASASDQPRKVPWSSAGTPSISAMTVTGSGRPSSAMTSMLPASAAASSSSSTNSVIRRTQALDHPRGERLVHQPPKPRVIRRIVEQHEVGEVRRQQLGLLGVPGGLPLGAAHGWIAQHRRAVLVAGEQPATGAAAVHRILPPETVVQRVGVGRHAILQRVEQHRVDVGHGRASCGRHRSRCQRPASFSPLAPSP